MPAHLRIARSRSRPAEYADALAEAVALLQRMREARDTAQSNYEQAQNGVMTLMGAHHIKTSTVALEDVRVKVSVVQSEVLEFNETSLRKALSAPVYDKLCDLKLNRLKLEEAVADGRVDPVVVATYTTVTPRKPYVKFNTVKGSET